MFGYHLIFPCSDRVKQQLWDGLPGQYQFSRERHHEVLINGQKCIQADLNCPSWGNSEIRSRTSTDPMYQFELLQISHFYLVTKTGDVDVQTEARVFRLQNREWSLWDTDGKGVVTKKITDLTLEPEIIPSSARLKAVPLPWVDEKGVNKYLGLDFRMSEKLYWSMHHRIEQREGETTVQSTSYLKIPVDRQEGWFRWFAEGVKLGFVGMTGYLKA
ncbi:MAG: hypothetical protein ALECFALPRED_005853 [Alectoria fallacina]|uniref:Uncharacterized protein n=1 Tax=Alectoria fallacina TaxID=1903189 RepID=A0A8H3IN52_9LECA|nr:MAG: hypothetical protein ALECFALPRED_005853 [Alectoria fallacina]